jgi:hypothetical protein
MVRPATFSFEKKAQTARVAQTSPTVKTITFAAELALLG